MGDAGSGSSAPDPITFLRLVPRTSYYHSISLPTSLFVFYNFDPKATGHTVEASLAFSSQEHGCFLLQGGMPVSLRTPLSVLSGFPNYMKTGTVVVKFRKGREC